MKLNTHLKIDPKFSGELIDLKEHYAKVKLITTSEMVADEEGLIHGGFTFSAADFCAMATVNHPNVVLTGADTKFLAPIKLGDEVIFESEVLSYNEKKQEILITAKIKEKKVFEGIFKTAILKTHVLKL